MTRSTRIIGALVALFTLLSVGCEKSISVPVDSGVSVDSSVIAPVDDASVEDADIPPAEDSGPARPPMAVDDAVVVGEWLPIQHTGGVPHTMSFDVPADATRVTIQFRGDTVLAPTVCEWTQENQAPLIDYSVWDRNRSELLGCRECTNFSMGGIAFAPNTSAAERSFVAGVRHRVRFCGFVSSTSEAHISITRGDANRVLDVVVHVDGVYATSENASSHPIISPMLSETDRILSQIGIRLGRVTFRADIDAAFVAALPSDDNMMLDQLADTTGTDADVAHIYLIATDTEFPFVARAHLPGGPLAGHVSSVFAIMKDGHDGIDYGRVLTHELGHLLGLFHSSELFGELDGIDDTIDKARNNLMYYRAQFTSLTPGQAAIAVDSPLLHPGDVAMPIPAALRTPAEGSAFSCEHGRIHF